MNILTSKDECCENCYVYGYNGQGMVVHCRNKDCPCHFSTTRAIQGVIDGLWKRGHEMPWKENLDFLRNELTSLLKEQKQPESSGGEWEKEFDAKFGDDPNLPQCETHNLSPKELKSFITTLLEKEKATAYEGGLKEWENVNKQYKSREEAFAEGRTQVFDALEKRIEEEKKVKNKYLNGRCEDYKFGLDKAIQIIRELNQANL